MPPIEEYRDKTFIYKLGDYNELISAEFAGIKFESEEDFAPAFAQLDAALKRDPSTLEGIAALLDPACGYILPQHMYDFEKLLQKRVHEFKSQLQTTEQKLAHIKEQKEIATEMAQRHDKALKHLSPSAQNRLTSGGAIISMEQRAIMDVYDVHEAVQIPELHLYLRIYVATRVAHKYLYVSSASDLRVAREKRVELRQELSGIWTYICNQTNVKRPEGEFAASICIITMLNKQPRVDGSEFALEQYNKSLRDLAEQELLSICAKIKYTVSDRIMAAISDWIQIAHEIKSLGEHLQDGNFKIQEFAEDMDEPVRKNLLQKGGTLLVDIDMAMANKDAVYVYLRACDILEAVNKNMRTTNARTSAANFPILRDRFFALLPEQMAKMYPQIKDYKSLCHAAERFVKMCRLISVPLGIALNDWSLINPETANVACEIIIELDDNRFRLVLVDICNKAACTPLKLLQLSVDTYTQLANEIDTIIKHCENAGISLEELLTLPLDDIELVFSNPTYFPRLSILFKHYCLPKQDFFTSNLGTKSRLLSKPDTACQMFNEKASAASERLCGELSEHDVTVFVLRASLESIGKRTEQSLRTLLHNGALVNIDDLMGLSETIMRDLQAGGMQFTQAMLITREFYNLTLQFALIYINRYAYAHSHNSENKCVYNRDEIEMHFSQPYAEVVHNYFQCYADKLNVALICSQDTQTGVDFRALYELLQDINNTEPLSPVSNSRMIHKIAQIVDLLKYINHSLKPQNSTLKHLRLLRALYDSKIGKNFIPANGHGWMTLAAEWTLTLDQRSKGNGAGLLNIKHMKEDLGEFHNDDSQIRKTPPNTNLMSGRLYQINYQAAVFNRFFYEVAEIRNKVLRAYPQCCFAPVNPEAEGHIFAKILVNQLPSTCRSCIFGQDMSAIHPSTTQVTPYAYACEYGNHDTLKTIMRWIRNYTSDLLGRFLHVHGFDNDINGVNQAGNTPILEAVAQNDPMVVSALLVRDCDLSRKGVSGLTPLQLAVKLNLDTIANDIKVSLKPQAVDAVPKHIEVLTLAPA